MTFAATKTLLDTVHLEGTFFDGAWKKAEQRKQIVEPATGAKLGDIGLASPSDINLTSKAARAGQVDWASVHYEKRAEVFRSAAHVVESNRNEIVGWLVKESASTRPKAEVEVALSLKALYEASAMPSQALGQVLPSQPGRLNIARRRPIGLVGVISPFNFPLYLAMRAVAPALAVGNSVLLKPDLRTSISGGLILARIFEEAGLPSGILSVLPGDAAIGEALCDAPDVGMIQFTGSTSAGRKVGARAGHNLKKVSLELGGKNAFVVLDDADVELAVNNAVWSTFLHQGQICMSAGRILVQAAIADEFTRRLCEHASKLTVGNPWTDQVALGPLISEAQVTHAMGVVDEAVAQGAQVATGGGRSGLFFEPTVLTGVEPENSAFEKEIFAPVAVVTTFVTDDDVINLVNDTSYGLAAAIVSRSVGRAMALAEKLNVGIVHVNDSTVNDEVINPFGGAGASGNGTSIGGPANWEEFTQWQWVTVKAEAPTYPL
ncbi:benzaldehyde dehydrogenase [Phyllobacterium ifriqiyense]|uniref:benzaldehyde dehydrogenase n=1 Tax=Phyllobacterium ifriqiyense TaxID=314238 RepID=UPI003391D215